jgi:hypothetical protein
MRLKFWGLRSVSLSLGQSTGPDWWPRFRAQSLNFRRATGSIIISFFLHRQKYIYIYYIFLPLSLRCFISPPLRPDTTTSAPFSSSVCVLEGIQLFCCSGIVPQELVVDLSSSTSFGALALPSRLVLHWCSVPSVHGSTLLCCPLVGYLAVHPVSFYRSVLRCYRTVSGRHLAAISTSASTIALHPL